jgi:hypothetical protein
MPKASFLKEAIKTPEHFSNSPQASYITATELRYCTILIFSPMTLCRVNIAFCGLLTEKLGEVRLGL